MSITILEKEGWQLNPNKKIVEAITKRIIKNNGECPCTNTGETRDDRLCPCKNYTENDYCCCSLYVKK